MPGRTPGAPGGAFFPDAPPPAPTPAGRFYNLSVTAAGLSGQAGMPASQVAAMLPSCAWLPSPVPAVTALQQVAEAGAGNVTIIWGRASGNPCLAGYRVTVAAATSGATTTSTQT